VRASGIISFKDQLVELLMKYWVKPVRSHIGG
jgi:hypothetical protein